MNNSKIRFGVIGCGYIARKAFLPALIESKNATLVAVSSRSAENAKIYANEGVAQFVFLKGNEKPEVTYAKRKGKYMKQKGVTLPKV